MHQSIDESIDQSSPFKAVGTPYGVGMAIDMNMAMDIDRSGQRANPCKDWVDESAWDNVTELDNLAAFSGLALSFEQVRQC